MSIEETNSYPNVSDRIKAIITDYAVLLGLMLLAAQIFRYIPDVHEGVRAAVFVFIFVLYDPLFTSLFGGTIGHMTNNIRVKRESDETKNLSFVIAFIRFLFKFLLGVISLFAVSRSYKRKAIHDSVVSSVVVYYKKPVMQ